MADRLFLVGFRRSLSRTRPSTICEIIIRLRARDKSQNRITILLLHFRVTHSSAAVLILETIYTRGGYCVVAIIKNNIVPSTHQVHVLNSPSRLQFPANGGLVVYNNIQYCEFTNVFRAFRVENHTLLIFTWIG